VCYKEKRLYFEEKSTVLTSKKQHYIEQLHTSCLIYSMYTA